jgi:glycosyltransferase involved in cell wall biosynthesis
VVSLLTEELVRLGHEVTLFASGDSETSARLIPACPRALWREENCKDALPHNLRLMEMVFQDVSRFDVLHFHIDYLPFPFLRRQPVPNVTTMHGRLDAPELGAFYREYPEMPLVSISDRQRRPLAGANWHATVYHGLPRDLYTFQPRPDDYLAFLGRISPEKGLDRAIAIARQAGMKLKVAAKICREYDPYHKYYLEVIEPLFRESGSCVEFIGEVGDRDKNEFLGRARAVLFPIDWPEPFGLVMIEALACGTPVIAFRRGSVPEVVQDGVTGFVVDTVQEAVGAVGRLSEISRHACRQVFEARFDAARMARDYLEVYRRIIFDHAERPRRVPVLAGVGWPSAPRRRRPDRMRQPASPLRKRAAVP